jgi:hypothetical protein
MMVRSLAFLLLMAWPAHDQAPHEHPRVDLSSQAEIPVRTLYQQIVSRPIGGIPTPQRLKAISPFLSNSLLHRIAQTRACANDWFRQHPRNDVKAPFMWGEFGLFSGADDRGWPSSFEIEKMELQDDGSFHAYVKFTEGKPPQRPWTWRVADVETREGGRYVIDDVIFLKDKDDPDDSRLSEILAEGCDGPRWVGFQAERAHPK